MYGSGRISDQTRSRVRGFDDFEPELVPLERPVDRYGFIKRSVNSCSTKEGLPRSREAKRVRKWRKMIGVGGIDLWKPRPFADESRVYEQLVIYETSASELVIIWDISRTFPTHVFFQQRHGPGQRSLCNVLKAYSVFDRAVGYVQVGLPLVQQYLFQFENLAREHLPKLGDHFSREMINPSMYASQWFITVFSYSFPFPLALQIWDVFLFEGIKTVFKVGLALLKYCHDDLIHLSFEKLVHGLHNFPEDSMKPDILLPMAYSIKESQSLSESKIEYEKKHRKTKARIEA
ncbi:Ypt/Rab-GAP domain of gyp1p superfamily protein isoform 4 [Hibiscus syriacus]|uniref:Ypt/Rab-GAP domain of gyp1p superfamily protein isoform 4 n=1 Tax=Hibiscus syriacus TaxID=106335 RepID=A0A6A2XKR2_HIBSY|nr:Ypt/Rab-GAP domain of gyp1p superfamily protein isoform 4 [Hibiscus syriacus]